PGGPDCLSCIFDQRDVKFFRQAIECVHVSALPVEMYRQDGANVRGPRSEVSLNLVGVEIECFAVNIEQHGTCSGANNSACGREKAECRRDDRIAWSNASRR